MTERRTPLLLIEGLRIENRRTGEAFVADVSLSLAQGETLAVIGESGAGKSITFRAASGLLPQCLRASGRIELFGRSILTDRRGTRGLLGTGLCYLTQQGAAAFDPLEKLGDQLLETARIANPHASKQALAGMVRRTLSALRFSEDALETVLASRPAQLSGGMLQRAMIAAAMLLRPRIVVADEPTSALDALSAAEVVRLLRTLVDTTGAALALVTHDLAVAEALARRVVVMQCGRIVEAGGREVLRTPQHPFSKRLVAARRSLDKALLSKLENTQKQAAANRPAPSRPADDDVIVSVRSLQKAYPAAQAAGHSILNALRQLFGRRHARTGRRDAAASDGSSMRRVLKSVDFTIRRGESVALVGASGAGKTTIARLLLGLEAPDGGTIRMAPGLEEPGRRSVVFQNSTDAIDPRWRAADAVVEALLYRADRPGEAALEAAAQRLLAQMALSTDAAGRRPHELSGGELQRVAFARAIAAQPQFIIFDEAMSALDVSVRADLIALLNAERRRPGAPALLFISHDLAAAAALADRILFLDDGRIVEDLPVEALGRAESPAARALLRAAREKRLAG